MVWYVGFCECNICLKMKCEAEVSRCRGCEFCCLSLGLVHQEGHGWACAVEQAR